MRSSSSSTSGEPDPVNVSGNTCDGSVDSCDGSGLNRRDFLRNGTVASAVVAGSGLAASRVLANAAGAGGSANDTINIGIVGTGGRGGGAAGDTLTINSNIRLVAMADLYPEKCKAMRDGLVRRHNEKVAVTDDKIYGGLDAYKRILDDPDVDIVLLTTPPGFRPYHIADAVKAGKHVFAEKPSCVDPAGYRVCLAAHEEAQKNGTAIVTGTQYRRQHSYVEAIKRIQDGIIGDIVSATTRYCANGIWHRSRKPEMSSAEYQLYNWMHFVWLSGDQITEQAVHNIDAMNWVMGGPPISAYGSGGRFTRPADSEMWDSVSIDYEYPSNRILSFMCRQIPGTTGDNGNVIYCTNGIATIGAASSPSTIVDRDGKELWSMKGDIGAAYKQEHKDLVDSIRAGAPIVELKQTAESSLTAVMGRMSAYTGQRVTWDFAAKESKLDLFPKDLKMDGELPLPTHAVPGQTKLI